MRDIRSIDEEEWVAASGAPVSTLLVTAVLHPNSRAVALGSDVLCLWGVSAADRPGVGTAWMIATNQAHRCVLSLQRLFARGIGEMHEYFPTLEAWAYHRNTVHHHWMTRMGFVATGDVAEFGPFAAPFLKFTRDKAQSVRRPH